MRSGTILGFPYQVQPAWLLIFAVLIVSVVSSVDGSVIGELSGVATVVVGIVVVGLFVGCIVAHEFSHAVLARRLGLPRVPIQLLAVGQPAGTEPDPTSPSDELKMALAGPVVSLVLGLLLLSAAALLPEAAAEQRGAIYWTLWWLGMANIVLAGFHLVPVLPLDGGRIVRAAAWTMTDDLDRATLMTANVGRLFGYLVIGSGLFIALSVDVFLGVWVILLGWFTTRLSRAATNRRRMEQLTAGLTVEDATDTDPAVIAPSLAVETLLAEDARSAGQGVYPVVDGEALLGVVFTARLRSPLRRTKPGARARDVLIPIGRAPSFEPGQPLFDAVDRLEAMGADGLPVIKAGEDRLYGVVTRARVLEKLRVRDAMARARDGSASLDARG
jgi:Zn-dependent protease